MTNRRGNMLERIPGILGGGAAQGIRGILGSGSQGALRDAKLTLASVASPDLIDQQMAPSDRLTTGLANGPLYFDRAQSVSRGDTLESLARRTYGDNWRAGVGAITSANGLRTNGYGSPVLARGQELNMPDLRRFDGAETEGLARRGGRVVSNNSAGLERLAQAKAATAARAVGSKPPSLEEAFVRNAQMASDPFSGLHGPARAPIPNFNLPSGLGLSGGNITHPRFPFAVAAPNTGGGQTGSQESGAGPGGFFGDFGLGLGGGFNLHFDRDGTTASVGPGIFGRANLGYAFNEQALRDAREEDRVFASAKLGKSGPGVSGEWKFKDGELSGTVGPVRVIWGPEGPRLGTAFDVGKYEGAPVLSADAKAVTFGLDGGLGALLQLGTKSWRSPVQGR